MKELNKWNKELERLSARSYKNVDKALFKYYKEALTEIKAEVKAYLDNYETLSFSKRMEVERQLQIAKQIDDVLWEMEAKTQPAVREFVKDEARKGYYGTWYALEDAEKVQLDFGFLNEGYIERLTEKKVAGSTLSKRLYENRDKLAQAVTDELIKGAAKGHSYGDVAKRIGELTEADYKKALRIARTEGGRAQSASKQRAYQEAEAKGVRLQKKWQSTLDKKTRISHQQLDGQTVDIDDTFKFNGYEADGPRLFGNPGLDINCRCTTITVVNGLSPEVRRDNETKKVINYKNYTEWAEKKGV